jgi:hypothetical protein
LESLFLRQIKVVGLESGPNSVKRQEKMQDIQVRYGEMLCGCCMKMHAKSLSSKKYADFFVPLQRYSAGLMTLAVCIVLVALVRGPPMRRTVMVSEWDVLSDNSLVVPKARATNARTQVC